MLRSRVGLRGTALALGVLCVWFAAMRAGAADVRWTPSLAPAGPLLMLVRLDRQRIDVFRNGVAIGSSPISSGRAGYETPTGVFTILQKDRDHRSNRYDDAPMPHMARLTWDGVALHGGAVPGYPASHGCIRLPYEFAAVLFEVTRRGDTVVITDDAIADATDFAPLVAPLTAQGTPQPVRPIRGLEAWWDDAAQPDGALSVVVSLADRRVQVLRNGVRIAESGLAVAPAFAFAGTVVYSRIGDAPGGGPRWTAYAIDTAQVPAMTALAQSLRADPDFTRRLEDAIAPGTSVILTSEAAGTDARDAPPSGILESDVDD